MNQRDSVFSARPGRRRASVTQMLPPVFHLGRTGGNYFYAMEFVKGETLENLIWLSLWKAMLPHSRCFFTRCSDESAISSVSCASEAGPRTALSPIGLARAAIYAFFGYGCF